MLAAAARMALVFEPGRPRRAPCAVQPVDEEIGGMAPRASHLTFPCLEPQGSAEGENVTKDELALDVQNAFPEFTASLQTGKTTIKLTRKSGDMDVKVIVDLCTPDLLPGAEDEEPEEGQDEEDMAMMALRGRMTAHVPGRDTAMTVLFHIPTAAESGIEIASALAHSYDSEAAANDEVSGGQGEDVYAPPNFDDLDFSLQASFVKFMGDCGLGVEFAEGVRSLADRKEQFEYLQWLSRAHAALEGTTRA